MNVYDVTRCPKCGEIVTTMGGAIMIHSYIGLRKLDELIASGMSMEEAAKYFCGACGNYTPTPGTCDCSCGYEEQSYHLGA